MSVEAKFLWDKYGIHPWPGRVFRRILLKDAEQLPRLLNEIMSFIAKTVERKNDERVVLVLYDIESNKVRRLVAKYLEGKGCQRIQYSVFVGVLKKEVIGKIYSDFYDMNSMYENRDSILLIPLSDDMLTQTRIIGKDLDLELTLKPPKCLIL